jgi:hypothetical protein
MQIAPVLGRQNRTDIGDDAGEHRTLPVHFVPTRPCRAAPGKPAT